MPKEVETEHSLTARSCVCTHPCAFYIEVISYTWIWSAVKIQYVLTYDEQSPREPAREHNTVSLISGPQRPRVELSAIKVWKQRKKQLLWSSGDHGTIQEATSACHECFIYSVKHYVPRFSSSAHIWMHICTCIPILGFTMASSSQAASLMLLISPNHQWGQLFSTSSLGELVRGSCARSRKLDVTHDGRGQKTGKKCQHFRGHHIPKVLTGSSRCGWRLSEATCLLLQATHTHSDWLCAWQVMLEQMRVCLRFTSLSISCSAGWVETCNKHPSVQLNVTMAIAVLKWQKQSERRYFLWFPEIVWVSFTPMPPWNWKISLKEMQG